MKNGKRLEVFFEFLVFGVIIGIVEDIVAVKLVTGENITWETFPIIVAVAIPFAFLGEIVVDRIHWYKILKRIK